MVPVVITNNHKKECMRNVCVLVWMLVCLWGIIIGDTDGNWETKIKREKGSERVLSDWCVEDQGWERRKQKQRIIIPSIFLGKIWILAMSYVLPKKKKKKGYRHTVTANGFVGLCFLIFWYIYLKNSSSVNVSFRNRIFVNECKAWFQKKKGFSSEKIVALTRLFFNKRTVRENLTGMELNHLILILFSRFLTTFDFRKNRDQQLFLNLWLPVILCSLVTITNHIRIFQMSHLIIVLQLF